MGLLSDIVGGFLGTGGTEQERIETYKPYRGGFGVGNIRVNGDTVSARLNPRYRSIVDQLLTGAGDITPSLSPEQLALGEQASRAGAGFISALQADPFDAAEEQFKRMESILEPGRERQRLGLEERLFAQGRLDSTPGATEQEALETAIEQSRRAGLAEAFDQAQSVQAQQAQIAQQLGAFGLDREQAQLQRMLKSIGGATAIEAMPIEYGNLLARMSEAKSQGTTVRDKPTTGGGIGGFLRGAFGF